MEARLSNLDPVASAFQNVKPSDKTASSSLLAHPEKGILRDMQNTTQNNILPGEVYDAEFTSELDLLSLDIIDFNRLNGCFRGDKGYALKSIYSGLGNGCASYSIYQVPDFLDAPECGEFPADWTHAGSEHNKIARLFFNWFRWKFPLYQLSMWDEPDFQAIKDDETGHHIINGDIGQVSASTFKLVMTNARAGMMWISVLDGGKKHVVITHNVNLESAT